MNRLESDAPTFDADCSVCSDGYARGVSNACHSCNNTEGQLLTWVGMIVSMVMILLLAFFAVVFLVGGLDAVDVVRKSVTRTVSVASIKSTFWSIVRRSSREPENGGTQDFSSDTIAPALDFTWENQHRSGKRTTGDSCRKPLPPHPISDDSGGAYVRPCRAVATPGTSVGQADASAKLANHVAMPASQHAQRSTVADVGLNGENKTNTGGESCCGLSVSIKVLASRLPLDKLKILVVVWQILTIFSRITDVEFPACYAMFLSWIDFVNLDIGHIFSASCVLPPVNFYTRLLVTTLVPLMLAVGLLLTYNMAKYSAGIGSVGMVAKRAAWSRHVAAGLLLTFLVRFNGPSASLTNSWAGIFSRGETRIT